MKAFTDITQSKKLAKILPLESADMGYIPSAEDDNGNTLYTADFKSEFIFGEDCIPCWSLAALLDVIPCGQVNRMTRSSKWEALSWKNSNIVPKYSCEGFDTPVDACYELILKLHEYKLI